MSAEFWEERYATGGHSGTGSRGLNAKFKADFLNAFVKEHNVQTVLEFGCGDGNQLALAEYPLYVGMDVSETAVKMCTERFAEDFTKSFHLIRPLSAELVLSLDVVYHLTEEDVYMQHLRDVFASASRWVIIYTTDLDYIDPDYESADHVRHWPIARYISAAFPHWALDSLTLNPHPERGGCDFYVYRPR